MRWFRMYNDTALDPRLKLIAFRAGTTQPNAMAVWMAMLCHAGSNKGDLRGTLAGWSDDDYAFHIGMDPILVYAIRKEMEGRLLDGLRIIQWTEQQYASDDAAARKRKQRHNDPGTPGEGNQSLRSDVTGQERDSDGTGAGQERDCPTPDTDTETDTEVEIESSLRSDSRAPAQAPSQARAARKSKNGFDYSDGFLLFWESYPRKQDQPAAWRAWKARRCDSLPFEAISDALDAYCADVDGKDRQFIKLPATWLNNTPWRVVSLLDQPSATIAESRHAKQH